MCDKKVEMMEIFMNLFEQENYLAKREGMTILHDVLQNKSYGRDFHDFFVSEKGHLKFTMQNLNDDSSAIQTEAFKLLLVFLKASPDKRGDRVNDTLKKNRDPLLQFIEEFNPNPKKEDKDLEHKKKVAQKAVEEL